MSPPKPRHIAINALHMVWSVNAATETYLSNIIVPWYESPPPAIRFTLICQAPPVWWRGERSHFRIAVISHARRLWLRILLEQWILPLFFYSNFDLIFHPGYVGSCLARVPQLVTIHDAFAWVCPKEVGRLKRIYWKTMIPASARRADRVVAVAHATASDIAGFCGVDTEKISVVHLAGDHLDDLVPDSAILGRLGVSAGEYFHCVGVFKDIKNPWRILSAFHRYRANSGSKHQKALVMVGYVGGKNAAAIERSASMEPGVVVAGRVSDKELAALYLHSAGLVFPSLYEGFGLPVLEAQRLGCPVITSNLSCMPEVAGNGAILVDPTDVEEIFKALVALDRRRPDDLIALGKGNAARFSWQIASQTTLRLIMEVFEQKERL